ncbi:MAG: hypothetical protein Fur0037_13620 [Planctomycetota bacterium]
MRADDLLPGGLAVRQSLALLAVFLLTAAFLFGYVVPRTRADFVGECERLLDRSAASMREQASAEVEESCGVLVDVIRHTAAARRAALEDLPLGVYGGDVARIRRAIAAEDEERSERLTRNVKTLAQEMTRRSLSRIERHVRETRAEQQRLSASFGGRLSASVLALCAAALALQFTVLGFGLHRLVVRPAKALRSAMRRVAGGDLETEVATAARDEIGQLSRDFEVMVGQLRDSRRELQRLNEDLEREVERKTSHLERALADLKAAQGRLVQAEKMASIGTLAGGIAHEFNNLIGGIRGCAAEARASERDEGRRETLDVIVRAADRAMAITSQLLRFSRSKVENRVAFDLAHVLEDALKLIEPETRRRRVVVERAIASPLPVRGDPDSLHQVFVNLCTNALFAVDDGGTIRVEAQKVGASVEVSVQDDGCGIDAADFDHLFEPFFSKRRPGAPPGTGLGLSVSYGIVDAHGGSIAASSTPGRGTRIRVRLPSEPPGEAR